MVSGSYMSRAAPYVEAVTKVSRNMTLIGYTAAAVIVWGALIAGYPKYDNPEMRTAQPEKSLLAEMLDKDGRSKTNYENTIELDIGKIHKMTLSPYKAKEWKVKGKKVTATYSPNATYTHGWKTLEGKVKVEQEQVPTVVLEVNGRSFIDKNADGSIEAMVYRGIVMRGEEIQDTGSIVSHMVVYDISRARKEKRTRILTRPLLPGRPVKK